MTDNVTPFPTGRFSQTDKEALSKLSDAMIADQRWGWIQFGTTEAPDVSDWLAVGYPGIEEPHATFGRALSGAYFMMDSEGRTIREGRTMDEVIAPTWGALRRVG